jgi:hypothetical protein
VRALQFQAGDPQTDPPNGDLTAAGGPFPISQGENYALDRGLGYWQTRYLVPVHPLNVGYVQFLLRDATSDPYAFRLCFDILSQVRPVPGTNSAGGLSVCTVHESDGRFRNLSGSSGYSFYGPDGRGTDNVLRDIDWGNQIYSPF